MKLVAGLGNPGPRYARSRHNVGFVVVDELARRWGVAVDRFDRHFEALLGEATVGSQRVLLLKPQTYMNLSGRSVAAACRFYKVALDDLLVVYDDVDLPVGQIRIRAGGSSGGQKGMEDVLRHMGSQEIARIRVGIGKVHRSATVDHVLGTFAPDERESAEQAVWTAADAVECWLREDLTAAMNRFNRRADGPPPRRKPEPPEAGAAQGESS